VNIGRSHDLGAGRLVSIYMAFLDANEQTIEPSVLDMRMIREAIL
jgi:hypothetical protein